MTCQLNGNILCETKMVETDLDKIVSQRDDAKRCLDSWQNEVNKFQAIIDQAKALGYIEPKDRS